MVVINIFATLVFLHFLFDYPLQGDFLSRAKNKFDPIKHVPWYHAMFAHCFLQAGAVYIVLGVWWIAALEFIAHFMIDYSKCRGEITYSRDQILHIACKAVWIFLVVI